MIHLENENFDDLIKDKTIVDFYATWCGPCRMLGSVFEEVSNELESVKFVKVDIDKHEDLCKKYKVMSVPTLILFENGKEIKKSIGFIPKDKLKDFIEH